MVNNKLITLLTGAFMGATLVTLLDRSTRKKIKKNLVSYLDQGEEKLEEFEEKAKKGIMAAKNKTVELKSEARKKLSRKLEDARNKLDS